MGIEYPFITIIIPCRNEEKYIGELLEFLKSQNYPNNKMEIFIVDGLSTDNTRNIVNNYNSQNNLSKFTLLENPKHTVPFALNLALQKSTGNPIVRMDVHTRYDKDYLIKIIETFEKTKADIVGGPMRAVGKTYFQKAAAYCTSTKFGVGNSSFHNEKAEGYVDSVYLGAWKREIFADVGMFDEQLKRNQDDEFHYRAKSKGKKLYLNPEIKSWYTPRSSFRSLAKQYFEYGLFKPLVLKKVSSEIKLRHLAPAIFVLYISFLYLLRHYFGIYAFSFLFIYVLLDIFFSFKTKNPLIVKLNSALIFPLLHLSYGTGFIFGLMKLLLPTSKSS